MAGSAAAHPVGYLGSTGGTETPRSVFVSGQIINACASAVSVGNVCFPVGHVLPAGSPGSAGIAINDQGINPASGTYCQDVDLDGFCGESGEPYKTFCISTVITRTVDWNTGVAIQIFIDGPVAGNPVTSPCGTGAISVGTTGVVTHT